jgi:hypothetical protein
LTIGRPAAGASFIVCTNHFLEHAASRSDSDSQGRFHKLSAGLEADALADNTVDFPRARELLKSVDRSGGVVTHLAAIVWPKERKLALAYSPKPGASAVAGTWITVTMQQMLVLKYRRSSMPVCWTPPWIR